MGGLKQPPEDIQFPGIRTLYITLCDKIVMENFSPSSSQCNSTSQVDKIKLKKKKHPSPVSTMKKILVRLYCCYIPSTESCSM